MLFRKFYEIALEFQNKKAVINNKREIKYGELLLEIDKFAEKLLEKGVKPYTKIGVYSNNSIEYLISFYGIAKVGAVAIPIDIRFTKPEIQKMVSLFDIEYHVYTMDKHKKMIEEFSGRDFDDKAVYIIYNENIKELDDIKLKEKIMDIKHEEIFTDDFLVLYTSGSTGKPKGILHTQKSMVNIFYNWTDTIGVKPVDEYLCTYVLTSAHAADIFILPALLKGSTLHVMDIDKSHPRFVADYIYKHKITVYTSINYFYDLINKDPYITKEKLQSLKHVFSGSAPLSEFVGKAFYEKFNKKLGNIYGMAEVGPSHLNKHDQDGVKFSSIGKPLLNMKSKIVDKNKKEVPSGEMGEVLLSAESKAKGYLNNPEETEKVFKSDGWVYSTDIGYKDEDGNFYIVGRSSQMINIGGNKVSPDEIDHILNKYPDIKEASVIGVNRNTSDVKIVGFIVPEDNKKVDIAELRAYCNKYLTKFKQCKEFISIKKLPRGQYGKVLRRKLEEDYENLRQRELL